MGQRDRNAVGIMYRVFGRAKRRQREPSDRRATFLNLRAMALNAVPRGLTAPPPEHPDVSGLVVDVPSSGGFVTFVALTDNTTSMYTSTGGGTIGAGERVPVAAANRHLLGEVQGHLLMFSDTADAHLPEPGAVRFHVLSSSGARSADVSEDAFWGREPHRLMPIIAALQQLISAINEASPG